MSDVLFAVREHLRQAQDAILAISLPLREVRDGLVRADEDGERVSNLTARISDVETGLFGIQNAIGELNAEFGGFTLRVDSASMAHEFTI
jgi:hypothetical protein